MPTPTYHPSKLIFLSSHSILLGNGSKIRFWKDLWWGNSKLEDAYPRLFHIALQKNAMIAEVLSQGPQGITWNLPFSHDLHEWEIPLVGQLMDDLNLVYISEEEADSCIWSPSSNDIFSYKSFSSILVGIDQPHPCSVHYVWKLTAPPKVKVFAWIAALNR